jgi:hypothetical protein
MNHTTLAVAAIVAGMAVTGITAMATPSLAWGHHHHNNGIKVNQSTDQVNVCSGSPTRDLAAASTAAVLPSPRTLCDNEGRNDVDIQR